jgi:hypothetical protein
MTDVICPYCTSAAALVRGKAIYPHRPDLNSKFFYRCEPCQAWVGCHPGTKTPLGRLANAELRAWKSKAHAAFDPVWRREMSFGVKKHTARGAGYSWLAEQLGIEHSDCHIGMMDVAQCRRVVEICAGAKAGSISSA